ncbi:MAG: hypothetical protein JSS96_07310 [Bacteroidetes bacterium]|nr:hypothetical protein [Bacteroidota bacterium]
MISQAIHIKQGWVLTLSLLIFFLNSLLPAEGLTLTLLLTPAWIYYLHNKGRLYECIIATLSLLPFVIIHLIQGVNASHYINSLLVIISVLIFGFAWKFALEEKSINLDAIFKTIVILNFLLVLASILLLFIPSLKPLVWYMVPISNGIVVPRLKLFTSEASHYSLWLAPIAIYFYTVAIFLKPRQPWTTLSMVTIPLLLSFSLGVLAALIISFVLLLIIFYKRISLSKRGKQYIGIALFVIFAALLAAYFFFPDNPLFLRLQYVWQGKDTSAKGRTFEAFILANKIIAQKSYLWGIGPGQLNILGRNTILQYYFYSSAPQAVRIPNASAETILFFGYVGLAFRITLELFLFFKTKVFNNPISFWLFAFVFIYQFTGSYITNVTEYIIWILAFSNAFPQLNNKPLNPAIATK